MKHYTVRPTHPLTLQARVATIEPAGTPVTVVGPDIEPTLVTGQEIFDAEGAPNLKIVATSTANITVTFADEVDAPKATRGELYAEAKKLDIEGRSSMDKDELIAAIRAAG
jgi:hypothetical protein